MVAGHPAIFASLASSPTLPSLAHPKQHKKKSRASFSAHRSSNPTHTHSQNHGQLYCFAQAKSNVPFPDSCPEHARSGAGTVLDSQALKAASPASLITGPTLACCSERVHSLLTCLLQLLRDKASSPTFAIPGPALFHSTGGNG